jgi:hypothetical protein
MEDNPSRSGWDILLLIVTRICKYGHQQGASQATGTFGFLGKKKKRNLLNTDIN